MLEKSDLPVSETAADSYARSGAFPTRLRRSDLIRLIEAGASDVQAGRYADLLPEGGQWPQENRWSVRLMASDDVDLWLISWVPGKSTELHDHAGSLGALTVVSGALREDWWDGEALRPRGLEKGDHAFFPLGWVHDVIHSGQVPLSVEPTLSVHAYSPPLTAMSYYAVGEAGRLRRTRSILCDEPEPTELE